MRLAWEWHFEVACDERGSSRAQPPSPPRACRDGMRNSVLNQHDRRPCDTLGFVRAARRLCPRAGGIIGVGGERGAGRHCRCGGEAPITLGQLSISRATTCVGTQALSAELAAAPLWNWMMACKMRMELVQVEQRCMQPHLGQCAHCSGTLICVSMRVHISDPYPSHALENCAHDPRCVES